MQLTDEPDKRCYPLQDHLFCRSCHIQSLIKMGCHPSNEIEVAYGFNDEALFKLFLNILT